MNSQITAESNRHHFRSALSCMIVLASLAGSIMPALASRGLGTIEVVPCTGTAEIYREPQPRHAKVIGLGGQNARAELKSLEDLRAGIVFDTRPVAHGFTAANFQIKGHGHVKFWFKTKGGEIVPVSRPISTGNEISFSASDLGVDKQADLLKTAIVLEGEGKMEVGYFSMKDGKGLEHRNLELLMKPGSCNQLDNLD